MASDNQITIVGNLTDDPELRYTANGAAVANFRVAYSTRIRDAAGNWTDGDTSFFTVNCWRALAENAAETLTRGTRVVVTGRLKQRSWENQEGEKRTVIEIEADDLGPSLKWATASVRRPAAPRPLVVLGRRRGLGCGGRRRSAPGRPRTRRHHWMPSKPGPARAKRDKDDKAWQKKGKRKFCIFCKDRIDVRRLQGRHHAAQVRVRARQDPRAARDRATACSTSVTSPRPSRTPARWPCSPTARDEDHPPEARRQAREPRGHRRGRRRLRAQLPDPPGAGDQGREGRPQARRVAQARPRTRGSRSRRASTRPSPRS